MYATAQLSRPTANLRWATALIVALAMAAPAATGNNDIDPPQVPANLEVPEGNKPYLLGQAIGTQNYMCVQTATGFTWAFFGPQATLFNGDDDQITTHFLSPNPVENGAARATWQHSRDTSTVWAATTPARTSTDPNYVAPGAIPWLLLETVGTQVRPGRRRQADQDHVHPAREHGGRHRAGHRLRRDHRRRQEGAGPVHDRLRVLPGEEQQLERATAVQDPSPLRARNRTSRCPVPSSSIREASWNRPPPRRRPPGEVASQCCFRR